MEYVIPAVIVVLLIAGFVTFMVLNATRKSGAVAERGDEGPGIGQDDTPLGDTGEHAGEQNDRGTTERTPEGARFARGDPDAAAPRGRPGEGEGRERLEFDGERPAPERVADRER
jgi:hypothetical protein